MLILQGRHKEAIYRCRTHPHEVSCDYHIRGRDVTYQHGCTMLHYVLSDGILTDRIDEVIYRLIQAMLDVDPNLPSRKAFSYDDRILASTNGDKATPTDSTPVQIVVYELFGCVLVNAGSPQSKYLAKILKLMLKANPEAAAVYNSYGLLPLHLALSNCKHGSSLIRSKQGRFQECFKLILDAHPQACFQRSKDEECCLPLHYLCMHGAVFGEASRFVAEELLRIHPAAAQEVTNDRNSALGCLCECITTKRFDYERNVTVDPNVFRMVLKASPSRVILGNDDDGAAPLNVLWKWSEDDADSSRLGPYLAIREMVVFHLLQSHCPHQLRL